MSWGSKALFVALAAMLLAMPGLAQDWGIGISFGPVSDVERQFRLENFDPEDVSAWVDFKLEEHVLLRGTLGRMRTRGENAGGPFSPVPGSPPVALPDLKQRIDYVTVGVAYQFWEGDYTSAIFGGLGGYKIDPDPVPDERFAGFRDPHQEVFGWHLGLEGDLRVLSRVSLLGRLTYHKIKSAFGRSLLAASAGAVFRF